MFNIDKRFLYILLGVLVLSTLGSFVSNPGSLLAILLTLPGVIIGITFHEFAHAFAADKLGDDTPRSQGRLTLNPLAHLDPVGFVLLLFAHIGWGKPVEINPRNFNRKRSMTASEAIVSIAGPGMNIFLAIIFTIITFAIYKFAPNFYFTAVGNIIMIMLNMAVIVNIGQGIFNLIPLPPLDGSKIWFNFLPYKAKSWFEKNYIIFYYIFLAIWITGLASVIISPIINGIYNGLNWLIGYKIFGIPFIL